ncbi:4-hydroxy-3-methylbut-2-enyl diphosphate reductase [Hyphococcus sp.]|uniref:4-hydroxy-3-methylbut-2-enyl diphosphate reductase n=1 Tax=Hyphococcus sp. TaxID=2038636 RepID=UPI003D12F07C
MPRNDNAKKPPLTVRLASPRGFCAGVERAIRTVEEALALHGAPVFVRHEIVHNTHVVARLSAMGAVFVEDLGGVPTDRPVVFSAHGAPRTAHEDAASRKLMKIDATCPLVLKVHSQIRRHVSAGRKVILIGHRNHPEVIGSMGQAPEGAVILVETLDNIAALPDFAGPLAYSTQTTLSVDETKDMIAALKARFPEIAGPAREDICYATSNRQEAVKAAAKTCDLFVVIGSPTSSNSVRLVETAKAAGAADALLLEDAERFDWTLLNGVNTIGLSAGASAPETLVEAFLTALAARRNLRIDHIETAREDVVFNTPHRLAS